MLNIFKMGIYGSCTLAALLVSGEASTAPLLTGDTVNLHFVAPFDYNLNVVVGPGAELGGVGNNFGIDITDTSVIVTIESATICGWNCSGIPVSLTISGMDFTPGAVITGVSLIDGGLGPYNPSFTAHSVSFDMPDNGYPGGGTFPLGVSATLNFTTAAVPEPSDFVFFGAGLFCIGARYRRKVKA